ncbi:MAG: hypothetical protein WCG66_09515 [bacterium]
MLETEPPRVGDEKLVTFCALHLESLVMTRRVLIRNAPAPPPGEQPAGMDDLLLKSGRRMTFQKRLIGGSYLGQIKKIPNGSLRGASGGRGF